MTAGFCWSETSFAPRNLWHMYVTLFLVLQVVWPALLLERIYSNGAQSLEQDENSCMALKNMPTSPSATICALGEVHWKYILVATAGCSHCAQLPDVLLSQRVCQVLCFFSSTEMWPKLFVLLEKQTWAMCWDATTVTPYDWHNCDSKFQIMRPANVLVIPLSQKHRLQTLNAHVQMEVTQS